MSDYTNKGTIKRDKPVLQILRGNAAGESSMLSASHPVADTVEVLSGMVIHPIWNLAVGTYEWLLGMGDNGEAYFATADYNGYDVQSSGKLTGLSSSGGYELATGYYDSTVTYKIGDLLTATSAGLVTNVIDTNNPYIIGRVSRQLPAMDPTTAGIPGSAIPPVTDPVTPVTADGKFVDSGVKDNNVLVFETIAYGKA